MYWIHYGTIIVSFVVIDFPVGGRFHFFHDFVTREIVVQPTVGREIEIVRVVIQVVDIVTIGPYVRVTGRAGGSIYFHFISRDSLRHLTPSTNL